MFLQRKREQADVRMTDIPIPAWAESGPSNEPISLVFLHGIGGGAAAAAGRTATGARRQRT